jgi:hypothetical protein
MHSDHAGAMGMPLNGKVRSQRENRKLFGVISGPADRGQRSGNHGNLKNWGVFERKTGIRFRQTHPSDNDQNA